MYRDASNYAKLINSKRILFVPTCIIIEIMATMYSHLSRLQTGGRIPEEELSGLLTLLRSFINDLRCTSHCYEQRTVKLFSGDWKVDRIKANRIFANLMLRMGRVYSRSINPYRQWIRSSMGEINGEWVRLFNILDSRCAQPDEREDARCHYFHSVDMESWQRTMAQTLLMLHNSAEYGDDESYLVLICYGRVKKQLINQIDSILKKNNAEERFEPERILCVSTDAAVKTSCPMCIRFTDEIITSSKLGHRIPETPSSAAAVKTDPA